MSERDFYQILGIQRDASRGEVRAAFIRLVRLHHPDATGDTHAPPWRLQEVQQAYRCLSDDSARDAHDRVLIERDRHHIARQRTVQQRLSRYDRHHPRRPPRSYRRTRWRSILIIMLAVVAAIAIARFVIV